jgi:AraC-like DNA-binding protein
MITDQIPPEVATMANMHIGIIARQSAVWDGVIGDLIVKGPTGGHQVIVEPKINTLFVTRTKDPHRIVKRLRGGPEQMGSHPGWLANFVAAGDMLTTDVPNGNSGMDRLALSITPRAAEHLDLRADPAKLELLSWLSIERPLIREIVNALASEIVSPGPYGRIYSETLSLALTLELYRERGVHAENIQIKPQLLAPWQLKRVTSYMRDNLAQDITLAELASLIGLSKSQFGRAFKSSTGQVPHQWLLNARINWAQQLLRDGALSLSEVALAAGFSDQSHFTRAFSRLVGTSPGAWRREWRR